MYYTSVKDEFFEDFEFQPSLSPFSFLNYSFILNRCLSFIIQMVGARADMCNFQQKYSLNSYNTYAIQRGVFVKLQLLFLELNVSF